MRRSLARRAVAIPHYVSYKNAASIAHVFEGAFAVLNIPSAP